MLKTITRAALLALFSLPVQAASTSTQACAAFVVQPHGCVGAPVEGQIYAAARSSSLVSVRVTAYNSLGGQTDSTPNITATGTRTRPGVVALSPDLRRIFPYGTRVWLTDPATGRRMGPYVVEDSTSARKTRTVDIWMYSRSDALRWGVRNMVISRA